MSGKVERVTVTFDQETCQRLLDRAKRYQKSMNLIVVEACRHLVGEEQKGKEPGDNGTRPETIKGGPKDPQTLRGWPTPTWTFDIGAEKTYPKVHLLVRAMTSSQRACATACCVMWRAHSLADLPAAGALVRRRRQRW